MNIEDRLRRAIAARTGTVEPSEDGLRRIDEKLLRSGGDMNINKDNRWQVVAAAAAIVLVLAGGALALTAGGDGDDRGSTADQSDDDTTTTTESTTTTEATTTTTTTAVVETEAPASPSADEVPFVVWPRPSSEVRFDDPVAAASSWARFYVGYTDPQSGAYREGDSRSGELSVFPLPDSQGPETIVFVRQMDDDHWFVTGSHTEDITVSAPETGAQLTCPQALRGTALAYEGTVEVRIDAYEPDGDRVEVASGYVTGSGSPPAGPFDSEIACTIPDGVEPYGIVRFSTPDEGEIGGNLAATTFTVRLH